MNCPGAFARQRSEVQILLLRPIESQKLPNKKPVSPAGWLAFLLSERHTRRRNVGANPAERGTAIELRSRRAALVLLETTNQGRAALGLARSEQDRWLEIKPPTR